MKKKNESGAKFLLIRLVKSLIGRLPDHIATAKGLGLRRINQVVKLENTACIRGMVNKISYLLQVEEVS